MSKECKKCGLGGRFINLLYGDKKATPYYLCEKDERQITNKERRELFYAIHPNDSVKKDTCA